MGHRLSGSLTNAPFKLKKVMRMFTSDLFGVE